MHFFGLIFVLLLSVGQAYAANCGGTAACQCGDRVTSNYRMDADLGPCSAHGLFVSAGVTLDGNGHTITGTASGAEVYGVYLRNIDNATVKNVVVHGFRHGMRLRDAHGNQILNNEFSQNGNFSSHVGYGIDIAKGSSNNLFKGNRVHNNADEGIHSGSGNRNNTFEQNSIYNNLRENLYVLASDNNLFLNNILWGGQDSIFIKDSSFNTIEGNTFRDGTVVVRADSHGNVFTDNDLINTGIHFQVYTKENPLRHPHTNTMIGGKIDGASRCLRFSSSWNNIIINTVLTNCGTDIFSDGSKASSSNTLVGVSFNPNNIQLDNASSLAVGWNLNVNVEDSVNGTPLAGARVRAFDASATLLFDVLTNAAGESGARQAFEYTQLGKSRTIHAPITIETTKNGYQSDSREIPLSDNTQVTVSLQPPGGVANTRPVVDAGQDQTLTPSVQISLNGTVQDDGLPGPPQALSTMWTQMSGPGTVGFTDATILNTSALFPSAGVYVLKLFATDGELSSEDTVTFIVEEVNQSGGTTDSTPGGTDAIYDFSIIKLSTVKTTILSKTTPHKFVKVNMVIQNQGSQSQTIASLDDLANVVHLQAESLGACPDPAPILINTSPRLPLDFSPRRRLTIVFEVELNCANDPMRSTLNDPGHEDYRFVASIDHTAVDGNADSDPIDDICPRTVTPPFRLDPNPDGTIQDKGCGARKADGTFGADILSDVLARR